MKRHKIRQDVVASFRLKPLIVVFILLSIVILGILLFISNRAADISQPVVISPSLISKDSAFLVDKNTAYVSLQSGKASFYQTLAKGIDGAREFILLNPSYASRTFIPPDFLEHATLDKSISDATDPFVLKNNPGANSEHYFFHQHIQSIPVYHAVLAIHLRNGNEIYAVEGNLAENQSYKEAKLTREQATAIAYSKAQKDGKNSPDLKIVQREIYILNKKVIGESEDDTNHLTLAVTVQKSTYDKQGPFKKKYFVDLATGRIVYEEMLVDTAIQRQVNDCRRGGCKSARSEGEGPVETEVDKLYDDMNTYYNFLQTTLQRDGIDGKGGEMIGNIRPACGNAYWDGEAANICVDFNVPDVTLHELTHGLTQETAGLGGGAESGALDESHSDTYQMFILNKWTNGVDGEVYRDAANPTSIKEPDKLFSPNWKCGGDIHTNGTIFSHTIYIMSVGGTFNTCQVSGIGRENAIKIDYQAFSKYLPSSTNAKDYYNGFINACNDLFPTGPTCTQVKAALIATEMDQQTAGTQTNPKCKSIAEQTPQCPQPVAMTSPTTVPSQPTAVPQQPTAMPQQPTSVPTQMPMDTPTLMPLPTDSPTPMMSLTPAPTFACLGSCPSTSPTTIPPMTLGPTESPEQPPAGGGNGGAQGLLQRLIQLLQQLLQLLSGKN